MFNPMLEVPNTNFESIMCSTRTYHSRMEFICLPFVYDTFFSDSDEEAEMGQRRQLIKISNYAERIVPSMNGQQFKTHFRISVQSFEDIMRKVSLLPNTQTKFTCTVKIEKQIFIYIWYLANMECFCSVAERFGVSKSTAWKILYNICFKLLEMNKAYKIIRWPNNDEANRIIDAFFRKTKFPGVLGAVDSSHIPIKSPTKNHTSYINRKGFRSVLLQGICDSRHLFLDVFCGEAGSIHDAVLFRRSDFGKQLSHLDFPNDSHILGDSAYALTSKCLVPYKDVGNLTPAQKNYNRIHSQTRVVIEQAYAFLKGRFRRLKLIENTRLDLIPLIIMSACILYIIFAFLMKMNWRMDMEVELNEERVMNIEYEQETQRARDAAKQKRNNIAYLL